LIALINKTIVVSALLTATLATAIRVHAAPPQQDGVAFSPAPCEDFAFGGSIPIEFDEDTECGWLTVPAQHADPFGPKIELGVVVLRATGANPRPDPLVMAQGGPGGSTIDSYASEMKDSAIRNDRDIVLFDQRGTRHTQPQLPCNELDDLTVDTIEQQLAPEESSRLSLEAVARCRERLIQEGVNLSAFDSVENAADVAALAQALGYDQINLYGVSYGTLLAQHVMRDHADVLRSVILDAVAPAQGSFIPESGRSEDRALTELFNACKADAACNAAYPELERKFYETVARLQAQPARVPVWDLETGRRYNASFDGEALQSIVFQALYATDMLPFLPYVMSRAHAGDYAPVGNLASLFAFDRSVNSGMYFSVMCAEDGSLGELSGDDSGIRPQVAERNQRDLADFNALCKLWDVDALPDAVNAPVQSDVPTLLLSGQFDPITPAGNSERVAEALNNDFAFVFPNTGHGAFRSEACANSIVAAFLDDPTVAPDASCIARLKPPAFAGTGDIVPMPALMRLTSLTQQGRIELALFGFGLLTLLSAFMLIPLAWLARLVMNRNTAQLPLLAKLNPWAALATGAVLFTFAVSLGDRAIQLAINNNFIFLFGLPASSATLFWLPLLAVALTALMIAGVIAGWRKWGWLRRLYRALLTVAAVACIGVLISWGAVLMPLIR